MIPREEARQLVAEHRLWYHTVEVAPGVVTPGWFDLRPIVDALPWPDLTGMRCLDVGPYDGFLSFEMERRGAAEVIAIDIGDHADWDWPLDMRARGPEGLAAVAGSEVGAGFEIARRLLGSSAERAVLSVYDVSPERLGSFDFVICGSVLLHLRDPLRALERIRTVCERQFLSMEEIRLGLSLLHRRRALAELNGIGELCQWWVPNAAGHQRMIVAGGFEIQRDAGRIAIPFGPAHPRPGRAPGVLARRALTRVATGGKGVPCAALLAQPGA